MDESNIPFSTDLSSTLCVRFKEVFIAWEFIFCIMILLNFPFQLFPVQSARRYHSLPYQKTGNAVFHGWQEF